MKALTLTQPWAWLVLHAGKSIENRRWNTKFRGQFLIHASKKMGVSDYQAAMRTQGEVDGCMTIPPFGEVPLGGIVGVAKLVHVAPPGKKAGAWHFEDQHGFFLTDVRPLPFIPCSGALNFWTVPPEVAARCEVAIAEAVS